ncbi:hypothetical protein BH24ACI3_BH24ACI3_15790 [soil metagenome]
MKSLTICILIFIFSATGLSQNALREIKEAELSFINTARNAGPKQAFLAFLSADAVVFQPTAVNGLSVWQQMENSSVILERTPIFADISSNGVFGYTTGHWKSSLSETTDSAKFGQYVTIWQRSETGSFKIALDITTTHEEISVKLLDKLRRSGKPPRDKNKKGPSAADATMDFFRLGNNQNQLGGAYEKYSSGSVRLLIDGDEPVYGKKDAVYKMSRYRSMEFPTKIAMLEAADMAYVWNPCEFDNSAEGKENGSCLHIWKLQNKRWWLVVGVFTLANNGPSAPPQLHDVSPKNTNGTS